jgi:hypothetical protein
MTIAKVDKHRTPSLGNNSVPLVHKGETREEGKRVLAKGASIYCENKIFVFFVIFVPEHLLM